MADAFFTLLGFVGIVAIMYGVATKIIHATCSPVSYVIIEVSKDTYYIGYRYALDLWHRNMHYDEYVWLYNNYKDLNMDMMIADIYKANGLLLIYRKENAHAFILKLRAIEKAKHDKKHNKSNITVFGVDELDATNSIDRVHD